MTRVILLGAVVVALGGAGFDQATSPLSTLDLELAQAAEQGPRAAIAVAVSHRGRITWERGYGFVDTARTRPATPRTPFAVGSIAKTVTATALIRLAERGVIDLDRPVHDYLGDEVRTLVGDRDRVTPLALASMTAGIPHLSRNYWVDNAASAPSAARFVRRFALPAFPPGDTFHYSNTSFGVLERLIEKVGNGPFDDVVQREVFAPLRMADSFFASPTQRRPYAVRRSASGDVFEGYVFTEPEGGAGLVSSAHDLAVFGTLHAGGANAEARILSDASLARMRRPVHTAASYGLGMFVFDDELVFDGAVNGGAGIVKVIPSEQLAVSIVTNAVTERPVTYAFIDRVVAAALQRPMAAARTPPPFFVPRAFEAGASDVGVWSGHIDVPDRKIPMVVDIQRAGVAVSVGTAAAVLVSATTVEGNLRFNVDTNLGDGSGRGAVTVRLHRAGDLFTGFAQGPPSARDGLALPRYLQLRRRAG